MRLTRNSFRVHGPIDVCEISRDGISEQRYFSLDEVRVASLRDYREGARANAGI